MKRPTETEDADKMSIRIPVVRVPLIKPDGEPASFCLVFYGIDLTEFLITPGGGFRIREALERRGLAGYMASPFFITQIRYTAATPRPKPPAPIEPPPPPKDPPLLDRWIRPAGFRRKVFP